VLRISGPAGSLLLTGDAELAVERDLVAREGGGLNSVVLVAGHHGSATSSSPALLAEVQPRWVLFSAGYRNRYGFPRPEVVERLRRSGAGMADTISGGALEIEFLPGRELTAPNAYRFTSPRYWNHQAAVLASADSGYDASQ
jgi:competence protein ComEC